MKGQKLSTSGYTCALVCLLLNFSGLTAQTFLPRLISTNSNSNAFYEYLPQSYASESETYPLIVFLHGVGELGNGNASSLLTVLRNGPPKLINEGKFPVSFTVNGEVFKFIIICPQFIGWPSATDVQGVIDYAVKNYRVNTNRIYLTGLSMGGGGAWDYASYNSTNANRLAALLTVCGASGSTPEKAQVIASANLPVWATHNQVDPTVSTDNTIGWINAINASSPGPAVLAKKTIFPVNGHDAWTTTYNPGFKENNLNVYEWMLQYQRGSSRPPNQNVPATVESLLGKIEAENYSSMSGVQSETTTDAGGGRNVGFIDSGDWMDYTVNVAIAGTFTVNLRVASPYSSQQLILKNSSGTTLSAINIPQTGAFQNWTTISTSVVLPAGNQTIRVFSGNGSWNINWLEFNNILQIPAGNAIPGKIESENYATMMGIQAEATSDAGGGQNIGFIDSGDWMDYNATITSAGTYTVNFRVASPYTSQQLQLKNAAGTTLATVSIPQTSSFQSWTTVSAVVSLPAGSQSLRIYSTSSGWNINWMEFVSGAQMPAGTAIPGRIEAEDYTSMNGVQSETTYDMGGGRNVGFIDTGDWMEYLATVTTAGTYTVNIRIASPYASQQLQLISSSGSVLTTFNIPQTGSYQSWTTVTATVSLQSGNQTLRIYSSSGSWNINWIEFLSGTPAPAAAAIPGKIEAEKFDAMNGIGTEATTDTGGGQNVGWVATGDWMDYNTLVAASGNYTVNFRVATNLAGQQLQLRNSSGTTLGTLTIPQTGNYQSWTTASMTVNLPAGYQTLRIYSSAGSWNINWVEFVTGGTITNAGSVSSILSTTIQDLQVKESFKVSPNPVSNYAVLQMSNSHLGTMDISIADQSGRIIKTLKSEKNQIVSQVTIPANMLPPGVYFIKVQIGKWSEWKKLVKY